MPAAADLPPELAELSHRNAIEIRDERFDDDVAALETFLAGELRVTESPDAGTRTRLASRLPVAIKCRRKPQQLPAGQGTKARIEMIETQINKLHRHDFEHLLGFWRRNHFNASEPGTYLYKHWNLHDKNESR